MKINRAMELHHGPSHAAAQALFRHVPFKEFLIFSDSGAPALNAPEERSAVREPQAPARPYRELQEALPRD